MEYYSAMKENSVMPFSATWMDLEIIILRRREDPDAGRDRGREEKGRQGMRWLGGITDSMGMSLSKLQEWGWTGRPGVLRSTGSQRVGHD